MPFPIPRLDDRSFDDLMEDAVRVAAASCPEWTDRTASDPMITLLEASAYLTDLLIYRVNRIPENAYIAFLNLIGAKIAPPSAAVATVVFTRTENAVGEIEIPAGTVISGGNGEIDFVLPTRTVLPANAPSIAARVLHCRQVEAEQLGVSNGQAGQSFTLAEAPVIAPTEDNLDLIIGVEQPTKSQASDGRHRIYNGVSYRIWQEVDSFANKTATEECYICDRTSGTVAFAPALRSSATGRGEALAATPPEGVRIMAWYRTGGGLIGNVAANQLNAMRPAIAGLHVTNPERAGGGRNQQSVDEALTHGPMALHNRATAITARDFETAALSTRAVARARAFSRAQARRHGEPGVVEVHVIPFVDDTLPPEHRTLAETLIAHRSDAVMARVQNVLEQAQPIGITTLVKWGQIKAVSVNISVVCYAEEDTAAVKSRLETQIYQAVSPFTKRAFGAPLHASEIHDIVSRERGIRYVEKLAFEIGSAPDANCREIRIDPFQPRTWYAVCESAVFRTMDDGQSWACIAQMEAGQDARKCAVHPLVPGLLAISTHVAGKGGNVMVSTDCGDTWQAYKVALDATINDIAWDYDSQSVQLFMACSNGLYGAAPLAGTPPERIQVMSEDNNFGYWAVQVTPPVFGTRTVTVAAGGKRGVWASISGGKSDTFRLSGLNQKDVRILECQSAAGRAFLWAGLAAEAGAEGEGCARIEMRGAESDPAGWQVFANNWRGGSCEALCFANDYALAGSNRGGVLVLPLTTAETGWASAPIDNGLPLRDTNRLRHEVFGLAVRDTGPSENIVLAGGPQGVYRGTVAGAFFENTARTVFEDRVNVPEGWLCASGVHTVRVISDSEIGG